MTTTERPTLKSEAAAARLAAALHATRPKASKNPLTVIERHPLVTFAAGLVTLAIGAVAWPYALIVSTTAGVSVSVVVATVVGFVAAAALPFLLMLPFPAVIRTLRSKLPF